MNKWGTLICKNQGTNAIFVMDYHFKYCDFTGFYYIDNDSIDNSIEIVKAYAKVYNRNIIVKKSNNSGALLQSKLKTEVMRELFNHHGADVVFPVDCDMIWHINDAMLESVASRMPGFCALNYHFYVDYLTYYSIFSKQLIDDLREGVTNDINKFLDYKYCFWKYLRYKAEQPNTIKAVLFKNAKHLTYFEGDHQAFNENDRGLTTLEFRHCGCEVSEFPVISHNDAVRKLTNHAHGQMTAIKDWLYNDTKIGFHIRDAYKEILATGSCTKYFFYEHFLTEEELRLMIKNKIRVVLDERLINNIVNIPEITDTAKLFSNA